jgi:hypothetical protein
VTISSIDTPAHFTRATDQGTDCTATLVLHAGDTCQLRIAFDPSTTGAKSGSVTVHSNAADVSVAVDGTGIQTELSRSPASLSFGSKDIDDGATASQTATVTNSGSEDVTISSIDTPAHFTRATDQGTDCTATLVLHAGGTCQLRIAFDPSSVGAKSGSVTVHSNAADVSVAVDGTGTQTELSLSPTTRAFGNRDIDDGPTAPQSSTITNTGTEPVTLTGINPTGDSGDFPHQSGAGECSASQTLNVGDTCTLTYAFDPGTVGGKSATVTVTSNAPPVALTLTGQGIQTELSRSPATLAFGGQDIDSGATATHTSTVTNSGTETVSISSVALGGTDPGEFVRLTGQLSDCSSSTVLAAGETCDVRVQFDPSTKGDKTATVTIDSNAASITVNLTGTGKETRLSRSPTSLSFGSKDIDDGATAEQFSTITNVGSEDVTVGSVAITGGGAGDFARQTGNGDDCAVGLTLHANDTCKVRVTFDPSTVGSKTATATVSANGVDENVDLSGTGIQTELSRSPASLSFGSKDVDDGATASQFSTVTNSGTEPVTVSGVVVTGDFSQVTGDSADCVNGKSLNAGETCKVRVTFDPASTGAKSGTATVHSNAADVSVALDGSGIQTELSRSPASLSFGSKDIDDGAAVAQETTVTNSGTETVHLSGVSVAGTDSGEFSRLTGAATDCTSSTTLTAGQTCKVRVQFDPSTTGGKSANVTVASTELPDLTIALDGTGTQTQLSASPASIAFGGRAVGHDSATKTTTLTNTGSESVALASLGLSGPDVNQFDRLTGQGGDCLQSTSLTAGQSCDVRLRFSPTSEGAKSAALVVDSDAPEVQVALTGTGLSSDLTATPGALAFGAKDVDDGSTAVKESTLTNGGSADVTIAGVAVTGDFARASTAAGDCAAGTLLHANDTCKVRVSFDPSATGPRTGTATISSDSADVTVALSGSGTQTELTRSAGSVSAGSQDIDNGPTSPQASTLTNTGTEDVTISGVDVTGEFSQATGDASDCTAGKLLHPGDACRLRTQFDPSTVGSKTGTATVHTSAGDLSVALDGVGTQTSIQAEPTAIDYGLQDVASNLTAKESTVTNTGTEPVTLTDAGLSGLSSSEFLRVSGLPTDCAVGATLNANETCKLRARFVPRTAGAKSATLTLNSSGGVATVVLSGIARPLLRIPSFGAKASSTKKRRLSVPVNPVGGTVRSIVVQVRSGSGKLLGTGTRGSASRRNTVTVKLRAPLQRGFYRATARGRDALGNVVTASRRSFRLR